jgi:predicted ribosome quality control (RQC) complex YloA/Tae2 family protein
MKGMFSFAEMRAIQSYIKRYEGGFIEKNYSGEEGYSFKLRKSGMDSTYIHFVNGNFIFLSPENKIGGKKNLLPIDNIPVDEVKQAGTDRILELRGPRSLIVELMGGGNIAILQNRKILFTAKPLRRKGKILREGEDYEYPEFIDLESEEFDMYSRIKDSTSDPVRTLASRLGLSKYADEILCALKIEIRNNDELLDHLPEVKEMVSLILKEASNGELYIYEDEFYVWKSFCNRGEPQRVKIIDGLQIIYEESKTIGKSRNEAIMRNVAEMQEEAEKYRRIGEFIMSNLEEVDNILKNAKTGKNGIEVDYEKETVTMRASDLVFPIKLSMSPGENADNYFKMSKRIRDRLSRVKMEPIKSTRVQKKETRRVFTNYRWFINSDGNLVLAGRDASSNDSVVKKYLDEKDLYFHADIHGAPSVVMKVKNPPSDLGIEEAASFAWCMSRSWSARFGNGAVYYVTKSQVSKTPESGEYLARGAWIVRGKKNFITHLNLEIAIGIQLYENREYVVSAPPSSIKGRKVTIIPGEGKEEIVNEISDYLGVEKDSIYPVLPPGGWEIKEKIES